MRVSLVMTSTGVGGVWHHITHLAEGLRDRGHIVELGLRSDAARPRAEAHERGFRVRALRESLDPRLDVWHIHLHDTYDAYAAGLIAARRVVGTTVATEHLPHFNGSDRGLLEEPGRSALTQPLKTIAKRASIATCDAIIVPSERVCEFVRRRYRLGESSKLHAIPLGVPPQREAAPIPEVPVGHVLASGSIIAQKGFDLLAEAIAQATVGWPLTIIGEGPHRASLEAQLAGMLNSRATLPGWQDDPLPWLDGARVVCLPSRWETFPFAAIEAQLAARPVVAFAVDGIPEIVEHGVTGILVDPGDVRGLAQALDRLATDRALAVRLGLAGRERALERFGLEEMLQRTESIYSRALKIRRGRRAALRERRPRSSKAQRP